MIQLQVYLLIITQNEVTILRMSLENEEACIVTNVSDIDSNSCVVLNDTDLVSVVEQ